MALQARLRASAAAASCSACRTALFHQFVSPFPHVIQSASRPLSVLSSSTIQPPPSLRACRPRFYTTSPENKDQEASPAENHEAGEAEVKAKGEGEEEPWYLDEEPRRHPTLTADALPPQPMAPDGTPPILSKLIPQLAEDLGLEDLKLLDLRSLDPPAALGPGLIMLFGTARSERHLHISGRVLKSWLRSQGVRADADGVLSRRALFIKARRQRKKAKLLGTAAVSYTGDEGIATRWISMNLGTIGSSPQEEAAIVSSDGKFAGFGVKQDRTGTTIIVQMFTESKRKELDLETLWSRILARRGKSDVIQDDLEYHEVRTPNRETPMFSEGASLKTVAIPSQRRFFSTSYRRFSPLIDGPQVIDPPTHDPDIRPIRTYLVDTNVDPQEYSRGLFLRLSGLQQKFAKLPRTQALSALEAGADGSTQWFITQWNLITRLLPSEQTWEYRMWLVARARKLGSRRFTFNDLKKLHEELELHGITCSRRNYLEMLQAIYIEPTESDVSLDEQSKFALRVLHTMIERGEAILDADVIIPLIESLARTSNQGANQRQLQTVLEKLIYQADLPYIGEEHIMRLLAAYVHQDNWDRFWEVWRMPPQHLEPRSGKLYLFLWRTIATTCNQRRCREAIRRCFFEMHNESPSVKLTPSMREAVKACARFADPMAEAIANQPYDHELQKGRSSRAEFVRVFRFLNHGHFAAPNVS